MFSIIFVFIIKFKYTLLIYLILTIKNKHAINYLYDVKN